MQNSAPHIIVIGAGIGGLASALRLTHTGAKVTVLDSHPTAGGKMRTIDTPAGPVDAGPTVFTLKPVFEALFSSVDANLEDHVHLTREDTIARHFWPDGTTLDLSSDPAQSLANVATAFGSKSAKDFRYFTDRAAKLFSAFEAPMMHHATPTVTAMAAQVFANPRLIPAMQPHRSLASSLRRDFSDPRLAQLFARYATYVGGIPTLSPALLALIAHAESSGVWHVKGGMHQLAKAIEALASARGARFRYNTHVSKIETQDGKVSAVITDAGRIQADAIVFNGDPNALHMGLLGQPATLAVTAQTPRSLSAYVHAFAAIADGPALSAHNVFFADNPKTEYAPLTKGQLQTDPTLYVCAQDRFGGNIPQGMERFEIIMNAAPTTLPPNETETQKCLTLISQRLAHFGLTFSPILTRDSLTTPQDFSTMFPASHGSLYGRSPHGMMAAFKRPTARTGVKGLYLAGGGAHPGAGVPMAALCAQHAVAAITQDLGLI